MLTSWDRALVARDPGVRGLATVLDPEEFLAAVRRTAFGRDAGAALPLSLRYRPGRRCVATYHVDSGQSPRVVWARASASGEGRGGSHPDLRIRVFPDDPKLVGLASAKDGGCSSLADVARELLGSRLSGIDLTERVLRYKPERRCVIALGRPDGGGLILKLYSRRAFPAADERARTAGRAPVTCAPQVLATSEEHNLVALEYLPGSSLRETIRGAQPLEPALEVTAGALADLHGSVGSSFPSRSVAERDAELQRSAQLLGFLVPELASRARRLADELVLRLTAHRETALVPIHGDFYDKQVLLDAGRAGLVDFDAARLGSPAEDLACFLAHLERDVILGWVERSRADAAAEALVAGSGAAGAAGRASTGIGDPRLRELVAADLLKLATYPFRHRLDRWNERCAALLTAAEAASG